VPQRHIASISVPSVLASFPTGGGKIQVFLPPTWIHLRGTGWSSSVSGLTKITSTVVFPGGNATLSTGWLAVMANPTFGSYLLHFRWQWTTLPAVGRAVTSPWSGRISMSNENEQPNSFYPAPFVGVASTTTLAGANPGSTFSATLTGNVSSTYFRILTESPTGHEMNSVCLATGAGLTTFNASIPLDYANGTALAPGNYVVHIHNEGGPIVVFRQLRVA
jgi:hypothetical protein